MKTATKWAIADIEKLLQEGNIAGYQVMNKAVFDWKNFADKQRPIGQKSKKPVQDKPLALKKMEEVLREMNIPYQTEYRFHDKRKFRFDIAIEEYKIAIEYEGLMSEKSRHTTKTGFTRDATKYNLAQTMGWMVLRYTVMNHTELADDLQRLLNHRKNLLNI